ncbi:PREDICTED: ubiquitin-like-specific protease 2 isoform X2 [Wasmannia auropunctata]|nr:PREDICTED: ubiquitin-like-specific protease 2 isoform X2 [Wasmannia auropunctata]XP_011686014.1 PREDICTED: ubiquitin-like-specific protease 2 isoform X2 [Wasmannia auropunctata]
MFKESSVEEDEESRAKKLRSINSNVAGDTSNALDEAMDIILDELSTIADVSNSHNDFTMGTCGDQDPLDIEQITLECLRINIGSYKCIPQGKVVISHSGIKFSVLSLKDDTKYVTLNIKCIDIIKLLIYFGKIMPLLFFYSRSNTGAMVRELLGMEDASEPYFNPAGKEIVHKRITLFPNKLPEDSKAILSSLFPNKIEELSFKEAKVILNLSIPNYSLSSSNTTRRRIQNLNNTISVIDITTRQRGENPANSTSVSDVTTRQRGENPANSTSVSDVTTRQRGENPANSTSVSDVTTRQRGENPANSTSVSDVITRQRSKKLTNTTCVRDIQTITIYPPPPAKGGISINTEDYLCLAEDEFLNDVIVDFYLKYLTLEVLSEVDQHRTHVFSSYFYKRLISPYAEAAESSVPMTPAAKRYARVQKWTKNVNIFEKDFIIIPINEYSHWFLAIICFPGLVGTVPKAETSENDNLKTVRADKETKESNARADEPVESKTQINVKFEEQKEVVKNPCILIFDSLGGTSRSRVLAALRDYLNCEHVAKLGVEKTFSKGTIKGAYPKVPQQSNLTDCGLYVLQYVESFFKDPVKDYTLPIKTLTTWFEEIVVTKKREELSNLLIELMNKGDKTISLPTINFPTRDSKLKSKVEDQTDVRLRCRKPKESTSDTQKH